MFVEFIEDRGTYKKGQRVEIADEAKAKSYIELEIAKASEAPKDETLPGLIRSTIEETLAAQFKSQGAAKPNPDAPASHPEPKKLTVPAEAKRYSSLRNFKGADADERAYRFGMWCLANYGSNGRISDPERHEKMARYARKAKSLGIPVTFAGYIDPADEKTIANVEAKASSESSNISSGFLVPDEFQNDLIDLREKFGVFRQNAKIVPMASDTRSDPRRRSGVTSYFVGEDQAGTQSTKNWDRVRLTAKKLMVLTKISNELNEDSVMNIGDDLAGEIAYNFAYTEDNCGFNGDGTSTYGGIVGGRTALRNVDATIANVLGLVVGSGTGYGAAYSFVLGDFNNVVATLPEYADDGNAKWYCSKFFWGSVMQKLATAAGGNRVAEIEGGALRKSFLGYDVVISQVMPKVSAVNQVACLFGDLRKAASLGDRRMTTISISDVALNSFEQDEIAIRGTERFDINVHDVGESKAATATPRDAVQGAQAGPIVGLITAAS